jgi:trk system potassium uptake protein
MRLVGGLLILVMVGTLLLMLPVMGAERSLTFGEAIFTATSALSVTGLSRIVPARDLSWVGQTLLLLLIQLGGVGFQVLAVTLLQFLGRRVSLLNRLALSDSFDLDTPAAILKLVRRILLEVLTIEGVGALLLYLHWRNTLGDAVALPYAIFHAVSAFCNAGFDLFTGSPFTSAGFPDDLVTLTILGTLIFLGGLGFPVLSDLRLKLQRSNYRVTLHTRLTLVTVTVLVVIGWLGIMWAETQPRGVLHDEALRHQIMRPLFQSISARTAGFVGLPSFEELTPASQMLLIALMFIGCAPASMGGGISTGVLAVLVLAVVSYARGLPRPEFAGRSIGVESVRRAAAVLTVSLLVVVIATWLILISHEISLDAALFEVVSAFATCGLTLAFTSQLNPFGQAIIIVMMFWGRLGALTIVVALAKRQRQQLVTYPEESVLLG